MTHKIKTTKNSIVCKTNNTTVLLDPKIPLEGCVNFVSHAHSDHLPTQNGVPTLASIETSRIAKLRGCKMDSVDNLENFSLLDSGHILGARGLLFDDIFYTGDICTRSRGFLSGAKIPKCKTLITECTFGLPEFIFPNLDEIKKTVNEIISEHYSRGVPVILFGYQLGKAQTISQLFGHWEPLYYHDSVKEMNDLHRNLGITLKDCIGHTEAEKNGLLEKKPWIMVAPFMSEKSYFIKNMKSKYGATTIGFSGWAKSSRFSFGRRADFSIPLSDHCDFGELVGMVKQCGADKVYTIHGFVEEFSAHLKSIGIDAQPLREDSLDDFI